MHILTKMPYEFKPKPFIRCPKNRWKVQNNALFVRLDTFIDRCRDVLELTETIVQFSKMHDVEVGGTKGKVLTTSVRQIYADFQGQVIKLKALSCT